MNSSHSPLAAPEQPEALAAHTPMWMSLRRTTKLTTRVSLAVSLLWLGGCTPDVGPCDPFAAREIVYLNTGIASDPNNGIPMFAGQGLLQTSCGDSRFCHADGANGRDRYGVPIGLDFDFTVPCGPEGCAPGGEARLRANQQTAFDVREHILLELQRGTMPPGREGAGIRAQSGTFVRVDTSDPFFTGGVATGEPLPEVDTREGRRIVANWLACGLPMVDRYENPNTPQDSGRNCRGSTDCVIRVEALADLPVPHWPSLYEKMIGPFCGASCHGEGVPDNREESQLDLGNIELAYDQMVNRIATGEDCIDGGAVLLIPGDPDNSLLIDKMENENPSCGDPMPSGVGRQFPPELMAVLRQWIREGAQEGCFDATFANGRASAATNPVFNPSGSFTLEAWIQATTVAAQQVIAAHQGLAADSNLSYMLAIDAAGQLEATVSGDGQTTVVLTHPTVLGGDEDYHHVALMFEADTRTLRLFVDGIPASVTLAFSAMRSTTSPFTIGDLDPAVGSAPFAGVISDVRLSSTARYALEQGQATPVADEPWFTAGARLVADDDTIVLYPIHEDPGATMLRDGGENELHATISGGVTLAAVECR